MNDSMHDVYIFVISKYTQKDFIWSRLRVLGLHVKVKQLIILVMTIVQSLYLNTNLPTTTTTITVSRICLYMNLCFDIFVISMVCCIYKIVQVYWRYIILRSFTTGRRMITQMEIPIVSCVLTQFYEQQAGEYYRKFTAGLDK